MHRPVRMLGWPYLQAEPVLCLGVTEVVRHRAGRTAAERAGAEVLQQRRSHCGAPELSELLEP